MFLYFKKSFKGRAKQYFHLSYIIGICILISFLASCQSKKNTKTAEITTPAFDKAIERGIEIHDSGNVERSLLFIDSAYHEIEPANVLDHFNYYVFFFNAYSRDIRDFAKASFYADTMLSVIEKGNLVQKSPQRYAQANFSKGDALFGLGNYSEAYNYFYKAKKIAKDNLDSCELDDYTYRLGIVLFKQERFAEAAENFKQSFTESAACEFVFSLFYRRQELLDDIGLCYYKLGKNDSALQYYDNALTYINENQKNFSGKTNNLFEQARAVIYGNLASVYETKGNNERAEELYKKSIAINGQKGNDQLDAQLTRLKLANVRMKAGDIGAAYSILNTVKSIQDSLQDKRVLMGWYNMMWQYYKYQNDLPNAFNYLLSYNSIKDTLDAHNKSLQETDMTERMKNLDKQYQISILQKNDELKRNYLVIALITSILSLVILSLIYDNWRKSSKNLKVLAEFNKQVNDQNAKLGKLLAELEAGSQEKDRILRAVAHDIRNPIAAISSLNDLMLKEDIQYTDEQKELLEHIKNACSDALTLSRDILEAADPNRLDAIETEWTNMNKLIKDSISILQFRASEKKQEILLAMPDAPIALSVNKEKIWRVISNLVTNAIKFSPEGARIYVTAKKSKDGIEVSVADNGIGIPNTLKHKVFDMFTEAKRPGTSGERPFGLGLSISRQIVEAHGGTIWFESSVSAGTTFYINIPDKKEKA